MAQFDWNNLDAAEKAAGMYASMNDSDGGRKHHLGGDRPIAQGVETTAHVTNADRDVLLRELLEANSTGITAAWLEIAIQTHRFSSPERKDPVLP